MKNLKKLLYVLIPAIVIASVTSCIIEDSYVTDYILVNSSGCTLEFLKYNNGSCDTATIDSGKEHIFFHCIEEMGHSPEGYSLDDFNANMKDSAVIWFDDGKKLIYKPLPVTYDSVTFSIKNIYDYYNHYEQTKIETGDKYKHHYEERFYITPEDYKLAK